MTRFTSTIILTSLALLAFAAEAPAADVPLARTFNDADLQWGPCPAFIPAGCQVAVLQGDPAKPNADVFFKFPGGLAIPEHWHTSAEHMVLISGQITVTFKDSPAVALKPGMYAYGPAKLPHKAVCEKGDSCVLFIAFESPVDAFPTEAQAQ
jgi:quercetin dioxygenase-like cupin family protein